MDYQRDIAFEYCMRYQNIDLTLLSNDDSWSALDLSYSTAATQGDYDEYTDAAIPPDEL